MTPDTDAAQRILALARRGLPVFVIGATPTAWRLSAESWTPGAGQAETTKTTLPTMELTTGPDGALPPWSEISGLNHASGVGAYSTTVVLPADWTSRNGAYLDLGKAVDTVRVEVNGQAVDGIDQSDLSRIDLGRRLRPGANTITVTVHATGGATYRAPEQRTGLAGPRRPDPVRRISTALRPPRDARDNVDPARLPEPGHHPGQMTDAVRFRRP
ncbi:MAG TPA: hypothetical protein VFV01_48245 [Spirillospora sp.]|nr:hypothetical protein [Spirillospora sp.]